jgi:sulfoxide reductase heme-binding subunit YedZ
VTRRHRIALKVAVWAACLAPLLALAWRLATDPLVTNPIDVATDTLGDWTLRILLLSLTMTPLRVVFGLSWPVTLRRLLGLFAFATRGSTSRCGSSSITCSTGPPWRRTS